MKLKIYYQNRSKVQILDNLKKIKKVVLIKRNQKLENQRKTTKKAGKKENIK